MMAMIFSMLAGVTIVVSRSINGYLAQKIGAYQSTFYNYLTGLIASLIALMIVGMPAVIYYDQIVATPTMLLGGVIGVFNILILNIVVPKIAPIKLTMITFVAQLLSGIVVDYLFFDMFTLSKLAGCVIVIIGLMVYQISEKNEIA